MALEVLDNEDPNTILKITDEFKVFTDNFAIKNFTLNGRNVSLICTIGLIPTTSYF
jgi:hypothetical protein